MKEEYIEKFDIFFKDESQNKSFLLKNQQLNVIDQNIKIQDIFDIISSSNLFDQNNYLILIYSQEINCFVYIGYKESPKREIFKISDDHKLSIILRKNQTIIDNLLLKNQKNTVNKRVKERSIKDVLENVALWRYLYYGYFDNNKKWIQMTLDLSANIINISKKTLDDYLSCIRKGKRYGFDFNRNSEKKIGFLRDFIKSHKYQLQS